MVIVSASLQTYAFSFDRSGTFLWPYVESILICNINIRDGLLLSIDMQVSQCEMTCSFPQVTVVDHSMTLDKCQAHSKV